MSPHDLTGEGKHRTLARMERSIAAAQQLVATAQASLRSWQYILQRRTCLKDSAPSLFARWELRCLLDTLESSLSSRSHAYPDDDLQLLTAAEDARQSVVPILSEMELRPSKLFVTPDTLWSSQPHVVALPHAPLRVIQKGDTDLGPQPQPSDHLQDHLEDQYQLLRRAEKAIQLRESRCRVFAENLNAARSYLCSPEASHQAGMDLATTLAAAIRHDFGRSSLSPQPISPVKRY